MAQELFIPPDGAMQFELTNCPLPELNGTAVWVDATERTLHYHQPGCSCRRGFPVLDSERFGIASVEEGATPCVCRCMGRFIE